MLTEKAKRILRKVEERFFIQTQQSSRARFNMTEWGRPTEDCLSATVVARPVCNTQACVAGEIVLAAGVARIMPTVGGIRLKKAFVKKHGVGDVATAASLVLFGTRSLIIPEAQRLFFFREWTGGKVFGWPADLEQLYNNATTGSQRAAVGLARVVRFRETDGQE